MRWFWTALVTLSLVLITVGHTGAGVDTDGDGFSDTIELYLPTDPLDVCPDDPGDDAYPPDINKDTVVNVSDVSFFRGLIPSPVTSPQLRRLDLNADALVTILDLNANYKGKIPSSCGSLDPVLVGAGDIASCSSSGDEATAALLDHIAGTVFTTGDNVYDSGTTSEFANCYNPSWGRHRSRTRPVAGNHEYATAGAAPYFAYFGASAGDPAKGYYSYNLGSWHLVVLNSNCGSVGGCGAGSPQEQWLRQDLATNSAVCTAAFWHHPLFSSGPHGNDTSVRPLWQTLYDYGADVVLNGHDHDYERFAPQDPAGSLDLTRGIREFVVGTGGKSHYTISSSKPNSEVSNDDTFGVLKLSLHATDYDWQFIPEAGKSFTDTGSADCVGAPSPTPTPTPTPSPTQLRESGARRYEC